MFQIEEIFFDCLDSTNTWAKANITSFPDNKAYCVLADEQTKGRGCDDRTWHSPKGQNIYATLAFQIKNRKDIICLSHILSYSLIKVLSKKAYLQK